jgi:hypothetical protein
MGEAVFPPLALHGWYMLTQFVDLVPPLEGDDPAAREERLDGLATTLGAWEDLAGRLKGA